MLNVEVKGISFANKGAELMLHAIIAQFAERGVDARFVVEPNGPFERRVKFGLWQKSRIIRKRVNILAPISLLPKSYRSRFGIINEKEIDLVLDASGFSYGDQWNARVAKDRLGTTIRGFRKRNVPVVVLPQALGPFERKASASAFKEILDNASLVFARDSYSLEYCKGLSPNSSNLTQCPDFTNLIKGIESDEFDASEHQSCFIPNSKMIEKRSDGTSYIDFMVSAIKLAQKRGAKPFILIHEAEADRNLSQEILKRLETPIDILDPQHALKIKWIIGQSKVVISSRFHGLVSALSQGVPVLATGWSHKYQELLRDYDCAEQLVELDEGALHALDKLVSDEEFSEELRHRIAKQSKWQQEAVTRMWDTVFNLI